ncbi:conserved exported protein of unknown function [Rhodovastum atsumiense]|nr:lysozyme inhibitor LprI family protein [Rhodovastum atsumiense]CAH2602754.1 conserved exported protein of unknown function [Rhodovastum atsumiense]
MMLRLKLTAVAFILMLTQAWAGSPELAVCMDHVDLGALKTTQWIACQEQELARQDHRLNAEYKKLRSQVAVTGKENVNMLIGAQRQWLAFREAWCNFEAAFAGAPGPAFNRVACMVDLTTAQADKLHSSLQ